MHLVVHPAWRDGPKGEISVLLDPEAPQLKLAILPEALTPEAGEAVEDAEVLADMTLHTSPDDRVPELAQTTAELLFEAMPAWLEERLLELVNGIHGFGTSRNPRGPAGKTGMDHPLAPLGIWGPAIEKLGREVRRGRFGSWEELTSRLDPVVVASIEDDAPDALRDDILGVREPRILLREPL